jgi:DNA repair exonuclease SbcCD ATPase subunit
MATVKEVLERVTETNSKLDALDIKLDDYKEQQNKVYNELEKRIRDIEYRHEACSREKGAKLDELMPRNRMNRWREWLLFLVAIAAVVVSVIIPVSILIQRVSAMIPGVMK